MQFRDVESWTVEDLISYLKRMRHASPEKRKWLWQHSDDLLWSWTKRYAGDKYLGQRFHSKSAQQIMDIVSENKWSKQLIHEHVVPRTILKQMFEKLVDTGALIDEQSIKHLMNKYCLAAIITVTEDTILTNAGLRQTMPEDWDNKDPWARYKAAGLYEYIDETSEEDLIKSLENQYNRGPGKSTGIRPIKLRKGLINAASLFEEREREFVIDGRSIFIEIDGELKEIIPETRFCIMKRFMGDNKYLLFPEYDDWYLVPYNKAVEIAFSESPGIETSHSWAGRGEKGGYSLGGLTRKMRVAYAPYLF